MSTSRTGSLVGRIGALLAVVGAGTFLGVYERYGASSSRAVSDAYATLATPAPYTFSIWGAVLASLVAFGIASLAPRARAVPFFDAMSVPVLTMALLATAWVLAFRAHELEMSLVVMGTFVASAARAYRRAVASVEARRVRALVAAPFSLLLGWLVVAAVANVAAVLVALGVPATGDVPEIVTIAALGVLALAASVVAQRYDDAVFPAAVGWGLFGVLVAHQHDAPKVAVVALFGALVAWSSAIGAAVTRLGARGASRPHAPSLRPRDSRV